MKILYLQYTVWNVDNIGYWQPIKTFKDRTEAIHFSDYYKEKFMKEGEMIVTEEEPITTCKYDSKTGKTKFKDEYIRRII